MNNTVDIAKLISDMAVNVQKLGTQLTELANSLLVKEVPQNREAESSPGNPVKNEQLPDFLVKKDPKPKSAPKKEESPVDSNPVVTIEQVRAVLAEKSQAGLTVQIKDLLTSFGAEKLSGVDPTRYSELLEAAKTLQ